MMYATSEYRFSHGREPRGRGSWAFDFPGTSLATFWTPGNTLYGDAKRLARKHVLDQGINPMLVAAKVLP